MTPQRDNTYTSKTDLSQRKKHEALFMIIIQDHFTRAKKPPLFQSMHMDSIIQGV